MKYRQERTGFGELDLQDANVFKMLFFLDNAHTNLAVGFHHCRVDCGKIFLTDIVQDFTNGGVEFVCLIHGLHPPFSYTNIFSKQAFLMFLSLFSSCC